MTSEVGALNNIVDNIPGQNIDINSEIDNFADILYYQADSVFGVSKSFKRNKTKPIHKYKSPFYTHKCEVARRDLKNANRALQKTQIKRMSVFTY